MRRGVVLLALGALAAACSFFVPFEAYDRETARDSDAGDAGQGEASSCIADLRTDPKHCGACDHDCRGTPCAEGLCEPTLVLPKQNKQPDLALPRIALDGAFIYYGFANAERVDRAPKTSYLSTTAFASVPGFLSLETNTANDIYYRREGDAGTAIGRLSKARTGDAILGLPSGSSPSFIQHDDARLYYLDETSTLFSVDLALATTPVTILTQVGSFTVDDAFIYLTNRTRDTVKRIRKDGSEPLILAPGQKGIVGLVADDAYLYWCNLDPPASPCFRTQKTGGGAAEMLVTGGGEFRSAFGGVTGGFLYGISFTDPTKSERDIFAWRVPKTGGAELKLTARINVVDLVIDDEFVYWTTTEEVFRVAK